MRIAIYCGSSSGKSPVYEEAAVELGKVLAKKKYGVVYGGSTQGLMGKVADAALSEGGEVIGVMPKHLMDKEKLHTTLTELYIVDSMHTRKKKMSDLADAFVALPGGCGTLDEYFEAFTWAQIGIHQKPVILYNVNGFYDALIQHFEKMMAEGFLREHQHHLFKTAATLEELLALLEP
ncbi:TIGR00730 family Rossman fold protein [Ureibacillus thermophilus]|uniref:LOG family protein n=1 Tax=Ureibacillus thermophilus TaxID=367743 RepID=UPI001C9DDBC6|nr:TIGR00730 family Rossman fold protein [Ureibacillus thermophilus]